MLVALVAMLRLVLGTDSPVETGVDVATVGVCLAATVWALARGERLLGVEGAFIGLLLAAGIATSTLVTRDPGAMLGGFVLMPLLLAYLAWALPRVATTIAGAAALVGVAAAALANEGLGDVVRTFAGPLLLGIAVCLYTLQVTAGLSEQLAAALLTDPLTGALNRRGLGDHLDRSARLGVVEHAIIVDLDRLKTLNDTEGHAAGDRLLVECVARWREAIGGRDAIARIGGDEFAIIVRSESIGEARQLLERVRAVSPSSFSAGVVPIGESIDSSDLFDSADAELYEDKGRRPDRRATPMTAGAGAVAPRRHTHFTVAATAAAMLAALHGLLSLPVVASTPEFVAAIGYSLLGCVGAVVLGVLGRRAPRWIVMCGVVVLAAITCAHLIVSLGPAPLLSGLFGLVPIALLVGGFSRRRVARPLLGAYTVAILIGIIVGLPRTFLGLGPAPFLVAVIVAWFLMEMVLQVRRGLEALASEDPLTGAVNRLGLDTALRQEIRRAGRRGGALALVLIDFDRFKQLNDRLGHARGDAVLRSAVDAWRGGLREGDVLARLGGDEFAILLPGADESAARSIMTRLEAASDAEWSWGVAELRAGDQGADLIERADRSLYAAKRAR
ncbi:GGDEF domain-containing protein [Microbacterium sediminis]|nr:GGDEF domain-containing protein [Microbacterium sediminis]